MPEKKFTSGEAIGFGWEKMKQNFWFFFQIFLVVLAVNIVKSAIDKGSEHYPPLFILSLGLLLFSMFIGMNMYAIALKIHNNEAAAVGDLFANGEKFLNYIWSSILYFLIVFGGFLLLIVPGIIWSIKYRFYPYIIIEKNLKGYEALKASAEITQNNKWNIFVFSLVLVLLNIAGALVLLIGLFFTIPASMVAFAYVYKKLSSMATESPAPVAQEPIDSAPAAPIQ